VVMCLGWFSKAKKRTYRRVQKNRRFVRRARNRYVKSTPAYRYYKSPTRRKYARKMKRFNRRHKVVGLTPDYYLSPIDAVPYVGPAAKGYRGYKWSRKTARAAVNTVKGGSREYSRRRGRKPSDPSGRRRRRGTYYYYRGKRIYRK